MAPWSLRFYGVLFFLSSGSRSDEIGLASLWTLPVMVSLESYFPWWRYTFKY